MSGTENAMRGQEGQPEAPLQSAWDLRDSVVLSCARSCQLQRTPSGKLLILNGLNTEPIPHNAEVVGSSPTLATNF